MPLYGFNKSFGSALLAVRSLFTLATLLFFPAQASSSELIGQATVIDGDTIEIHGQRIRLHGIDAPESRQLCEQGGQKYRCGQRASLALADKIGRTVVRCDKRGTDRYKRVIGICFSGDEVLNRWMVRTGWAVAYRRYSKDYVIDEDLAHQDRIGIWAGDFEMPSEWRRKSR